jgi:hypothetical protein
MRHARVLLAFSSPLFWVAIAGCHTSPPRASIEIQPPATEAWCPPKVWGLLSQATRDTAYVATPDMACTVQGRLSVLMAQRLSMVEFYELIEKFKTLPVGPGGISDEEEIIVRSVVDVLCKYRKDTLATARTLAAHYPDRMSPMPTEAYLALVAPGPNPLEILAKAYFLSENSGTKEQIAYAFRHGFTPLGVRGQDDAHFISNALAWYMANKNRVEVNFIYCLPGSSRDEPLFVPTQAHQ